MNRCAPAFAALLLGASPSLARHDEILTQALENHDRELFYHVVGDGAGGEIYTDQAFAGPFTQAVGLLFDAEARLWVWEKSGRAWVVGDDGTVGDEPVIDISEEVGDWSGHGCLGFAVDPAFAQNGYIYLFYVVDRHHLLHFGTPSYDPATNDYYAPTQGRLTRYQVFDPSLPGDEIRADPASRTILIGDEIGEGFPVCSTSHGVGSLVFAEDGNLLASFGDGYLLGSEGSSCLSDGLISSAEDVANYRAQLRDSHGGKVLRFDPATGEGVPSNPFYDALRPDAPISRVWASGFRNPFRLSVRPGTGGPSDPGVIYLGDVGATTWEELNVIKGGGRNLGWPIYEGMEINPQFGGVITPNSHAPNPLFGQNIPGVGVCQQEFFDFQDLLHQETLGSLDLPNPCDSSALVPLDLQRMHVRPQITWKHDEAVALVKTFDAGNASFDQLGEAGAAVIGSSFEGNAAVGGVWYTGTDFPAQYQNSYFLGDFGMGWIKCLRFDSRDRLVEVIDFTEQAGNPVAFATHPSQGELYYVDINAKGGSLVRKISFVGDLEPVAVASVDQPFGPSPHVAQFRGYESTDYGGPLTYAWDFGDGSPTVNKVNPVHVYANPGGAPTSFVAKLTVTDSIGQTDVATTLISVDNTPPSVAISSPLNGSTYPATGSLLATLEGVASDPESGALGLDCVWEVFLHHDNHFHPEPPDANCDTTATLVPHTVPSDVEYYEIRLTVTDEQGLSASDTHYLPRVDDCNLNGFDDAQDIAKGWSLDLNMDGIPDECSHDCDGDGLGDWFTLVTGVTPDCNANFVPDACEVASGAVLDLDGDGVPDTCQPLSATPATISVAGGGAQFLTVSAGAEHAGDFYWVFGSLSGPTPPTPFGSVLLPLALDAYFAMTLTDPTSPLFANLFGFLDVDGMGSAQILVPAGSPAPWAGITLTHAAIVIDAEQLEVGGIELVTNWSTLTLGL